VLVHRAVWYWHLAGRPITAYGLAHFVRLPRQTVVRRLKELIELGCVVHRENHYYVSDRDLLRPSRIDEVINVIQEAAHLLDDPSKPVPEIKKA
jgi:DNA-binding IclR family transcriptional regulator